MKLDTNSAMETITLRIDYDRKLWRRAMSGWWRGVVPSAPFLQRAIFWAVVWVLIALLAAGITALGLTPYYVLAGLIGAAFLVGVFGYLQRTRMSRFWDVVGTHWDKAGTTEAVFGPDGISMTDAVSRREFSWSAIDAVNAQRGVTVFRTGFSMIAVPDIVLPDGMTGKAFRAQLAAWRELG